MTPGALRPGADRIVWRQADPNMRPKITSAKPALTCHSPETGTDYAIYIDAPASKGPHPALFVMDGDYFFDASVAAARALAKAGRIPPVVVVGVGYGVGFGKAGNFRGRDYTPTAAAEEPSSGGADAFLAFLSGTLWPRVSLLHPIRESHRVIGGHSLGSLLVLHALFQEKPFFTHALASAPSIWWDNRSILGLIGKLRDRQARLDGRLYLGVGADDSPSMTGDLALLEQQLRARPFAGLRVESEQFPGHDHFDAAPLSMRAGLVALVGHQNPK
jgi:predicted alpha/beta superfamily hydrolase